MVNNLIKRVLSALVLVLILIPLCIAGGKSFTIAVSLMALFAFAELLDLKKSHSKIPNGIVLVAACILILLIVYEYDVAGGIPYVILSFLSLVLLLPTLFPYKKGEYETKDAFYLIGCICFLGVSFHSVLALRSESLLLFGYVLSIPIITDTMAMLFGKLLGKKKIAPVISPNKTYAGAIFGSLFGTIFPTMIYYFFISKESIFLILGISFVLSILGQMGDLLFSKIKRENDIKDFSNLIPGHGGILDRFDSFLFVVLLFLILKGFIG